MPRQPKPDHFGQGILPGCAHYRPKSKRKNGRRRGDEQSLYPAIQEVCDHRPGIVAKVWRNNSGLAILKHGGALKLAPIGSPDFVGWLVDGRALLIEVKLEGEQLTFEQLEWKALADRTGAVYLIVHSREDLVEKLEAIPLREAA